MMRTTAKKIAILFPGGGVQYTGMGKHLYDRYEEVRKLFGLASEVCGTNLEKLCFHAPTDELSAMRNSQMAIYLVDMAFFKAYELEIGLKPSFLAGHSLGEYAALTAAGVLTLEAGLEIVRQRGLLLQAAGDDATSRMATVNKGKREQIENACLRISRPGRPVGIAAFNSPGQFTLSGDPGALNEVSVILEKSGAEVVPLPIAAPSHSSLMQPFLEKWRAELDRWEFSEPAIPVISNVTAREYISVAEIREQLVRHLCEPVQWESTVRYLLANDVQLVVETGPRSVLRALMGYIEAGFPSYALDHADDVRELKKRWAPVINPYRYILDKCLVSVVSTPNFLTDRQQFKEEVELPIGKLKNLKICYKETGDVPGDEGIQEVLTLTRKVLEAKKLPEHEVKQRMNEITSETGIMPEPVI